MMEERLGTPAAGTKMYLRLPKFESVLFLTVPTTFKPKWGGGYTYNLTLNARAYEF
jgi:hypothetical protein